MNLQFFTPAQYVGYIVMILGISAYMQKVDWRLKLLDAMQNIAYCLHFYLLGNPAAAASSALAFACSICAMRFRSIYLALIFIAANVVLSLMLFTEYYQLLATVGLSLVAWAMFTMKGAPMRIVILGATLCWLVNDFLSGSIGGTILEVFIAVANTTTILRMYSRQEGSAPIQ
jgi:hypothetical protein